MIMRELNPSNAFHARHAERPGFFQIGQIKRSSTT
jgi:hypothetical protein